MNNFQTAVVPSEQLSLRHIFVDRMMMSVGAAGAPQ